MVTDTVNFALQEMTDASKNVVGRYLYDPGCRVGINGGGLVLTELSYVYLKLMAATNITKL